MDLSRGRKEEIEDYVATDRLVRLLLNGEPLLTLVATPSHLRELALGHLLGEGLLRGKEEVEEVKEKGLEVHVRLRRKPSPIRHRATSTPSCGASDPAELYSKLLEEGLPRPKGTRFGAKAVSEALGSLHSSTGIFRRTGGTHAAALFTREGKTEVCLEDVGRHNAVDKVLGWGLERGVDFGESFLGFTGRVPAEVVAKCLRAGIPLLASLSAPLESGINLAEAGGLTLVGFARGSRLNVYAHPERLVFNSEA